MNVLQFPIIDEYFQHTLTPNRSSDYVAGKGLHYAHSATVASTTAGAGTIGRERKKTGC